MSNYNIGNWSDIDTKGKQTGQGKFHCPECYDTRKNKRDRPLFVNLNSGVGKCFNCDTLFFRESIQSKSIDRRYTLPPQTWYNFTQLSDSMVAYFSHQRKISQYTLNHFGITEEKAYFPQSDKEMNAICFNYFEGDILVNKKYRNAKKEFTQIKGGKPILYNINSIIGSENAIIVEGEADVLAFYEIGIKEVVSLPNGANDNDAYWINSEPYLKDIKHFFIATDNDEKGNIVADKIAQRLGRFRCSRIRYKNKDANDDLIEGVLTQSMYNIEYYPVTGTYDVNMLWDEMIELAQNGVPETLKPKGKWAENLNKIFSIHKGQLTTITGIPSHGKSEFTDWYILNLSNDYNLKVSWFSPEHNPMHLYMNNLATKVIGKYFDKAIYEEKLLFKVWANERLYLTSPDNGEEPNWDWLINKFEEQIYRYGINIFVIDAFNKVIMNGRNEYQEIRRVLTKLTNFCQRFNVSIFLVAHPTKMKKNEQTGQYEVPDLYSVAGSADFRNQTHNGYTIHRDFNESSPSTRFINLKTKFKWQGEIGKFIDMRFNAENHRFYDITTYPDNLPLWEHEPKEYQIKDELFDNNEEDLF